MAKKNVDEILDGVDATILELQTYITTQADLINTLQADVDNASNALNIESEELEKAKDKLAELQNVVMVG